MKVRKVIIRLYNGLRGLNAARFVGLASEFSSEIQVQYGEMTINSKSLMGVLCMDLTVEMAVFLTAEGPDSEDALNCLEGFLLEKAAEKTEAK